jgi:hypothetical protein
MLAARRLRLATDAVTVAVEAVRIGIGHVPEHSEVAVRNVRAVEVGRWRRDALVWIGRRAVRCATPKNFDLNLPVIGGTTPHPRAGWDSED